MSDTPIQQYLPNIPDHPELKPVSRRHFSYLITGVVAGLVLGYLLFDNQTVLAPIGNPKTRTEKPLAVASNQSKKTEPAITQIVAGTQIPGDVILVEKIVMEKAGWVAVADDQNGVPGRILGANYLPAGTYQNQIISLLRGLADEGSYFVVIHEDDGDKSFDYKTDLPRKNTGGQVEMVNFKVVAESPRGD